MPPTYQSYRRPRYHGSPTEHIRLLYSGRAVLDQMCQDERIQKAAAPTLLHPDLHKRNVFVSEQDPTVVTGIIDWQSASIEPAFWYASDVPDFARYSSTADNEDIANDELCAQAFGGSVRLLMPKLALPWSLDESLLRPFQYCHRTWKDGAVAFRHELIETAEQWSNLNLRGSCPFRVPPDEALAKHRQHYQWFVASQTLKRNLLRLLGVSSDGWVATEAWDRTVAAHKEMFANMLEAVLNFDDTENEELIRSEGDLREIWPFDL